MKLRSILRGYCVLSLSMLVACSVSARTVSYQDIVEAAKKGKELTMQAGDEFDLGSLQLSQKLQDAANIPIPDEFRKLITNLEDKLLSNIELKQNVLPKDQFAQSFSIAGTARLNLFDKLKGELTIRAIFAKDEDEGWKTALELNLPKNWKLRDMIPKLQKSPVGSVPLPDGQIILTTFDYKDEEGYDIRKGVNLAAHVSLEEVAPDLHKAIDKLRPENSGFAQSIVFDGFEDVRLNATITEDVANTAFDIIVPLRIGVDFQEMKQNGVIKRTPSGIRRITTGNIKAKFIGADQEASIEQGLQIYTTTQDTPLDLRSEVSISPNSMTMVAKMDGTWDPAITNWLAIENPAFEFNFDYKLMSKLIGMGIPIPFTGMKIKGGMGFGPKDARTTVRLSAGLQVNENPRDLDFAMVGSMDNVSFKQLADLFGRISKKQVPLGKLPEITLRDVTLYVVPKDMEIADKTYEAGFEFGGNLEIQKLKGGANFVIDSQERRISAEGYVKPFKIGRALVITGKGEDRKLGTDDDQASLKFAFPPRKDTGMIIELDGIVEVPVLRFKNDATIQLGQTGATFTSEGDIAGFEGKVNGQVQFKKIGETDLEFMIKPGALNKLTDKVVGELKKAQEKTRRELDDARKKIDEAKKKYEGKVEKEKQRIKDQVDKIKNEYRETKRKCDAQSPLKKPFSKDCWKVGKLKAEMLAKEKIYKDFLLKKGKKLGKTMSVPGKFVDYAKKMERQVAKLTKAIDRATKIKRVSGQFDVASIKQGKAPVLQIELETGKTIDVDFDPKELVKKVSQKLVKTVKA